MRKEMVPAQKGWKLIRYSSINRRHLVEDIIAWVIVEGSRPHPVTIKGIHVIAHDEEYDQHVITKKKGKKLQLEIKALYPIKKAA